MSYTITPSPDKTYILIKTVGDITAEIAMQQNLEAHALGKKLGIHKYLLDATESKNIDTVISNYKFAYEDMTTPEIDPSAKVAVIINPGDTSHDFVLTAVTNAGFNVVAFNDMESAKAFLMEV